MIIIIHGEDMTSSRQKLQEQKETYKEAEVIILDGSKLQFSEVVLHVDSTPLLFAKKLIVIENLLSGGISKQKEEILSFLSDQSIRSDIILWEKKAVDKRIVKKYFANAKEIVCKYPVLLWRFLESIGIASPSELVASFHALLKQKEAELVFAMILRQWRNLIIAKDLGVKGFSKLPRWQAGKFIRQASNFSLPQLLSSYRKLLAIDYKIKTGQTPLSLSQHLDFFFLNL